MSDSNKKVETEKKAHALEKWLDIEEGSTEIERVRYTFPSKKSERYDPKDREIEEEAHKIFEEAITGYHTLEGLMDDIEPKYRARMAEVALAYLKTALDASDSKIKQKDSIEKLKIQRERVDKESTGQGAKIFGIGDRNDILKALRDATDRENDVIDVTPEEDKDDS